MFILHVWVKYIQTSLYMNGGITMKTVKTQAKPKRVIDSNPNSKPNKEFRERHDISIPMFERLTKQYVANYG